MDASESLVLVVHLPEAKPRLPVLSLAISRSFVVISVPFASQSETYLLSGKVKTMWAHQTATFVTQTRAVGCQQRCVSAEVSREHG